MVQVLKCANSFEEERGQFLSNSAATGIYQQSPSISYSKRSTDQNVLGLDVWWIPAAALSLKTCPLINPYAAMSLYQIILWGYIRNLLQLAQGECHECKQARVFAPGNYTATTRAIWTVSVASVLILWTHVKVCMCGMQFTWRPSLYTLYIYI